MLDHKALLVCEEQLEYQEHRELPVWLEVQDKLDSLDKKVSKD